MSTSKDSYSLPVLKISRGYFENIRIFYCTIRKLSFCPPKKCSEFPFWGSFSFYLGISSTSLGISQKLTFFHDNMVSDPWSLWGSLVIILGISVTTLKNFSNLLLFHTKRVWVSLTFEMLFRYFFGNLSYYFGESQ